ncbi:hypothetical protein LJ739_00165 [Aestuariibacter halophilus]|uniref:Prepilin peptidase dependent protein B n=1 Tax=Fluctibacter halophilus TaxID=226011 RepID=A0ABS8G3E0_9ALTE|nr:hypothetical protein [Aestuariibacter halophilus]MCC2614651.1 hypothetical protein [Aestuariibacter halophilus]
MLTPHQVQGLTWLGMLLGLALSSVVILCAGVLARQVMMVYQLQREHINVLRTAQLWMFVMQREVQRAGGGQYSLQALTGQVPDVDTGNIALTIGQDQACVLFAYDRNHNGRIDAVEDDESYGYRLHDGALEVRVGGGDCQASGWHDVTHVQDVLVTELRFVPVPLGSSDSTAIQVSLALRSAANSSQQVTLQQTWMLDNVRVR